jgi:hypothetical protein
MLAPIPEIEALITAALYLATYLSFVRLLRHPRNWYLPTLPSILATAGLAIVTVAQVSLSSQGLDLTAMIVSAGFIAGLFSVIAAPAVVFRPGGPRPAAEFLAKHGVYAGLWMIPPAVVAGYALPDVRLYGLLVAAMTIELTWFLRHRRTGERRSYLLGDQDLLVLKAQAKGNIERFAKQHGIAELDRSDDGVVWNGCSKKTLPCPFNLYTNRLGLNTPPCCRAHMKDLSYFVSSCLREMGAVHWLEGGSLLGAVRENGNLLAWEDDVDLSVMLDNRTTWALLAKGLADRGRREGYYVDPFENKGFIAISYDPPGRWPFRWERNRMRGEIRLDLVVYRNAVSQGLPVLERRLPKGAMPLTENGYYGVPREVVLPTSTVHFLGDDFACPKQPNAYLHILYGNFEEIELTYIDTAAAETRRVIE